jgi:hypothetical protein
MGYPIRAGKWLKDRVNTDISYNGIVQYQNILYAIEGTIQLMKDIDDIICHQ